MSVPQLSLHIPRDSIPIHLGGTLRIDHPSWLLNCNKSMTNREEDELLSQAVEADQLETVVTTTTTAATTTTATENGNIINSINDNDDSGATTTENNINAQNGTTEISTQDTNGIITDIHWPTTENPPSSQSPSSGFSDDESLINETGDPKTIDQVVEMVRNLGRKGLLKEYAEIRARQPEGSFDHAKLRSNLTKNRYANFILLPYIITHLFFSNFFIQQLYRCAVL